MQAALSPSAQAKSSVGEVAAAPPLMQPSLLIELDQTAERFVQMLVDPGTGDILRRYPNETQLTFSRGVAAYQKALRVA